MKPIRKHPRKHTLGELILSVASCSRNSSEMAATITDLLESGRVRLGKVRVRVS